MRMKLRKSGRLLREKLDETLGGRSRMLWIGAALALGTLLIVPAMPSMRRYIKMELM